MCVPGQFVKVCFFNGSVDLQQGRHDPGLDSERLPDETPTNL